MHLDDFVLEGFFGEDGCFVVVALVFPAAHVEEVFIVALCFAFFGLVLFAEVTAARFLAVKRIVGHEFAHEDEVFETQCLFEFHVHALGSAGDEEIGEEGLAKLLEEGECLFEAFLGATHTDVFPHDVAEFLVDAVHRALTLDGKEAFDAFAHMLFGGFEFGKFRREAGNGDLVGEIVLDRVGQHEVSIGQSLHESRSAEAVGTVIGEVTFTDGEQTINGGHEFVVHPDTAHRVVDGGENLHGCFVGALVGDFFVHVEEVTVARSDLIAAEVADGLREVEIDSQAGVVHTEALVATFLGSAAGHVAGNEVTEGGIAAFEVVVAVFLGNVLTLETAFLARLGVFELFGHPNAAVVAERLGHEGEFRLFVAVYGDTRGVNLHIRGVGKHGTLAVASDGGRCVAAHGVGREEVGVTVTAGTDYHCVSGEAFEFAGDEITRNDTACTTVDDYEVEHLVTRVEFHGAEMYLAHERRVSTEKKLLTGLTFGVERTAHLCATERTVGQHAAIFASEGNTLCDALVDDGVRHFGETIDVGFASAVVTALHRIVEKAINRVTVVLIVLGGVDTTLSRNRVCTAGRVLDAEVLDLESHFAERSRGAGAGQSRTHDDNVELTFVFGVHQFLVRFIVGPLFGHGAFGDA